MTIEPGQDGLRLTKGARQMKDQAERKVTIENGTRVVMNRRHPHDGKHGFVREQPAKSGQLRGMYLIEFDGPYEGNAYADREQFVIVPDSDTPGGQNVKGAEGDG